MTALIAPGLIVINTSQASGGVTYDREILVDTHHQQTRSTEFQAVKHIDNETVVRALDAAIKEVDYTLRRKCLRTPFGHFITPDRIGAVRTAVAATADLVTQLNAQAAATASNHRGRIGIVTAFLDVQDPANVRECCRFVAGLLAEVYAALRTGSVADTAHRGVLRPVMLRAANLGLIAAPDATPAISAALAEVAPARTAILAELRRGVSPPTAGLAVPLPALGAAIRLFERGAV